MNIRISGEWLCFIIPLIIIWLYSLTFSNEKTGGSYFPASSSRTDYWFFGIPAYLISSFLSWALYLKFWR